MTGKKRIFIAEDEHNISDFIRRGLEDFDYHVTVVNDGTEAWEKLSDGCPFDLVILDIRMLGKTGLEVCKLIRTNFSYSVPVLMLTALGTTDDVVLGLHAGADDYLIKPFKFVELLARVEALLRRSSFSVNNNIVQYADLKCDPSTHKASRGDIEVELSAKEYRLLEYFVIHHDQVLTRSQLLRDVWDKDFETNTNVVDVYVRYVRNKIDDPFINKLIHTIVGVGYMMKNNE